MFHNRINGFVVPSFGAPRLLISGTVAEGGEQVHQSFPLMVPLADIYQAAKKKAIEDHEIDKLFNPDYFDYQI